METCHEIKSSEGGQAVSGKYWFHSIVPESSFLAQCDMKTEGEFNCLSILLQTKNGLPLTKALTEMLWVDCDPPSPPPPQKKKKKKKKSVERDFLGRRRPPPPPPPPKK